MHSVSDLNSNSEFCFSEILNDPRGGAEENTQVKRKQKSLRHRLHGRGFQSKRFHDLETASKTTRFQGVYTEPIQP